MTKDIEVIYEKILREIITLKIKPGARLKEVDLSERFHVSRTPMRDVFKRLESDKLLKIYSQAGSYVTKIDLSALSDIMFLRSATEFRVMSEVAPKITPDDLVVIKRLLEKTRVVLPTGVDAIDLTMCDDFFTNDNELHHYIYERNSSQTVLNLMNSSFPCYSRYRVLTFFRDQSQIDHLFQVHTDLIRCLETGDLSNLSAIVKEHNFSGLRGLEKVRERHPDYFL